ncbi:1,4-alpha-glucan branching enzyme [[Clostridium] polysaccharolyticum]|uniref:1,4-alpha-glucan branching enzyme GlgB n=1 Tax=[Clostridium] polysaccharolyticum TaxID=29364 RepID=A0A1I0DM74_9FIRM|nr:1,4-alpha-glucan branching enzyme [[Clostridium] polysaccharolyticum]
MNDSLYNLMNWERIESIVYSDNCEPGKVLGAHITDKGILVQAFFPDAKEVSVVYGKSGKIQKMDLADEAGFFAALIKGKRIPEYYYNVVYEKSGKKEDSTVCMPLKVQDPYAFKSTLTEQDLYLFNRGIHYTVYEKLGAHEMIINGVKGTSFAVWAPNAVRVSVVGDFNFWDGRRHPMNLLGKSGVHQLFIPGVGENDIYKYEIKIKGDLTMLKSDPYGFGMEVRPDTASIVRNIDSYQWQDKQWMESRTDCKGKPVNIYEVHLGSYKKPEEKEFYNYRQLAEFLIPYLKEMNYTHIELLPVMEHPLDESWGYQVTGYYAPTSRYGTPEDFMYFMDQMHQNQIGVILDWVPAHFPRDGFGLAYFDGTCLYEHLDPRKGSHPHWGTLIYNYRRPEVTNFLIANALYWVEKYHADGIRMDAVASMLYLDYGKNYGEWVPNENGGNENYDAVEFLKHLNSIMKKRNPSVFVIAEESTAWPMVTGSVEKDGLGFDYKWNMGWMNDFLDYMRTDPLFRKGKHGELLFSMIYAYSEKFLLVFSHDEVVHQKGSMLQKMPGTMEQKLGNLRAAYGFMMMHPGKKLLFMGQEFAQIAEWNEKKELDWNLIEENELHRKMQFYVKSLNRFYLDYKAFYELDFDSEGFEWISCLDADHSVVAFVRKTRREEDMMLMVFNFTPVAYEEFLIGVPFQGKYKEVFNSDREEFGGQGYSNPRLKQSKTVAHDGLDNSIKIKLPPLGFAAFTCKRFEGGKDSLKKEKGSENKKNIKKPKSRKGIKSILKGDTKR